VRLKSDFVCRFLEDDLLTIILALFAINITTISVILSKLYELAKIGKLDFSRVINDLRISIIEQISITVLSFILLILSKSSILITKWKDADSFFQISLIALFSYVIWILFSTGEGIFKVADIENERLIKKHDEKEKS
jgi:hypothetical protein